MIHILDFEVLKYDWLCVIASPMTQEETVIVNSPEQLRAFYEAHKNEIYIGYNIRDYDQWIFKGILAGFDPYEINDFIINQGYKGYQFSKTLREYPLIIYDLLQLNTSLKQLEAFQGHDIYESTVDFRLDRKCTDVELERLVHYCKNDVQETMNLFIQLKSGFDSRMELINEFKLPLSEMSRTNSQVIAKILGAESRPCRDEFKLNFPAYLDGIVKYKHIVDWYKDINNRDYSKSLKTTIAGVEHSLGWGGIHGAKPKYYGQGYYLHIDVNSYYPSLMISHDYFSRAIPDEGKERFKKVYSENLRLKAFPELKKKRLVYKLICNSTYGCFKDAYNSLYDPLMANNICITGQLALTLLIEMLEPYVELIQSNTDGLIVKLPNLDTYDVVDDIAYEWEQLTGVKLGFDPIITKIYQKDVNNYLFINEDGEVESKGAYVKSLSPLDNDLPIINKALKEHMINNRSIEDTINSADKLIDFQKIVKLSSKYDYVEHNGSIYVNKCYRVFASKRASDGMIYKCKDNMTMGALFDKKDKFANTPEKCFLENGSIVDAPIPEYLDREYYINLAYDRLRQFGEII